MSGCPANSGNSKGVATSSGECPVKYDISDNFNPATNDLSFGQERQNGQMVDLSTERNVSSILKSDFTPAHQPSGIDRWVYPSEQQYFNAMRRKGYDPAEEDIPVILAIHNVVNEQGWSKVKEWESLRGTSEPKLKQFLGRPKDVTPKAYLWSLFGYTLPFDRHDWIVDRNGKDVRYVIDFYKGAQPTGTLPGRGIYMYLDVRPALDSPSAVIDRASVAFRQFRQFMGLKSRPIFNPAATAYQSPKGPPAPKKSS